MKTFTEKEVELIELQRKNKQKRRRCPTNDEIHIEFDAPSSLLS